MPFVILTYVTGLLYLSAKATCTTIAEILKIVSHDRLTRLLNGDWSGQILLEWAYHNFFQCHEGVLVIDDTVLRKSGRKRMEDVTWVYSSSENRTVLGHSMVLLIWTNGVLHIPLAFRLWKSGGPSKFDLALELLSYARNRLQCKPKFVAFDSWYASKALFKRIRDYGWFFVCRVKRNRKFNGKKLKDYHGHPYWSEAGEISGEIRVFVVRYGKKYFATNRLTLSSKEVREAYMLRHWIEEVFKFLKSQLHLEDCQAWSIKAQTNHVALCLLAYCVLERERQEQGGTIYKVKRDVSLQSRKPHIKALELLPLAA